MLGGFAKAEDSMHQPKSSIFASALHSAIPATDQQVFFEERSRMITDNISASAAMPLVSAQSVGGTQASQVSQVVPTTTNAVTQNFAPVGDTVNISALATQQSATLGNIGGPAMMGNPLSDSQATTLTTAQTSAVPTSQGVTASVASVVTASIDVYV
jgi:hypothetical protein